MDTAREDNKSSAVGNGKSTDEALSAVDIGSSAAKTSPAVATVGAKKTTGKGRGGQRHIDPLERDYDPTRDDLSMEELLARPRLPRSPFEADRNKTRTMPAVVVRPAADDGECAKRERAEEFEWEKQRLRALGAEIAKMKLEKK